MTVILMPPEMAKLVGLLEAENIPYGKHIDGFNSWRICIPSIENWDYSVICHPGSYGYPDTMEIGWHMPSGGIEVRGFQTAEMVLERIKGNER